jgi:hypothetical protein
LGKLVVEFRGKRYEKAEDVTEENVRRMLLTAVGELVGFSGGYPLLVDQGLAPAIVPAITPAKEPEPDEMSEAQARFLASLENSNPATSKKPKERISILPGIPAIGPKLEAPTPTTSLSPVEQIDAILQNHVQADPELAAHTIHLIQHPDGGLQITVDGQYYRRPRDLENPKIQLVIKKAIKEWEAR